MRGLWDDGYGLVGVGALVAGRIYGGGDEVIGVTGNDAGIRVGGRGSWSGIQFREWPTG